MSKWDNLKEKIANPPPVRLAKVEYQSYMLNILGVLATSIILIYKGYWYIIFAFLFGVGASYSQMITAYRKYSLIKGMMPQEKPEDFENEISPSRKRSKIINYVFPKITIWLCYIISIGLGLLIINPIGKKWYQNLATPLLIFGIFIFLYFFVLYGVAKIIYDKKVKGGKYNL